LKPISRNTNSLWASILTETLKRLGLTTAVIYPGSRSATGITALLEADGVMLFLSVMNALPPFCLRIADNPEKPVVLVCITAGANFTQL